MGWFNKKEEIKEIPKLPELPKLKVPEDIFNPKREPLPQLPSFPNNQFAEKFSQNAIKEAVSGQEEEEPREPLIRLPPAVYAGKMTREIEPELPEIPQRRLKPKIREVQDEKEPLFIRIDKFEESLEIFEDTKEKIAEMEKMLREVNKLRQDEDKELAEWGEELQSIKEKIDKVDKEIFSKI